MGNQYAEIQSEEYKYLVERFGEEKIAKRFDFVHDILENYVVQNDYLGKIYASDSIIEHIIVDYFVDIDRMKDFQEITYTNEVKIFAYLSYWILRHKPLQIKQDFDDTEIAFVNENFVADFLNSFLLSEPANVPIVPEQKEKIDDFVRTLEYYFCYKDYTAKSIELVLLAFNAGRGYQYSIDYQK